MRTMRERTELICHTCANRFYPKSGHLKQKNCSKECGQKSRLKNGGTKKGKKYPHLYRAKVRKCETCHSEFRAVKDFKTRKQKFCSKDCYTKYWLAGISPYIDRTGSGKKGPENPGWKGDDVGYHGLHKWVQRELGKPSVCEHCGDTSARKYEWANLSHEYKRDLYDWVRLCTPCHRAYDNGKIDVTCKRWQQQTGNMPILEATGAPHDFSS